VSGVRGLRGRQRGFTALELIAIVGILSVVALLAAPRVSDALINAQLQATVRQLAADAHHVRQLAIMRGATTRMDFLRLVDHPHQVRVYNELSQEMTEYRRVLPAGLSFVNPSNNFTFNYLGEPIAFGSPTPNLTIWIRATNGRCMFLILSRAGRIRISNTPPDP
jgi:Tfp pilus assembly protein FimT